ncbi:MAG: glycosyltransferase, partial [Planctomycetes bacterium]|nr:glycosyltransferase [Planctomycetota bacterium]
MSIPEHNHTLREPAVCKIIERVALIFDDQLRPETTGVYCRQALEARVEVEHVRPSQLRQPSNGEFDLYLRIDDGLDYPLPPEFRPSAWWAIDTHIDFERCLAVAGDFDFVFAAQKDGAERLRDAGIESATWLPLACDPAIHCKHEVQREFDVCFVGNEFPGPRADLLGTIQRKFLKTFVGQRYMDQMAKTYSASRIVFNRSVRNDINMRVFEALACGSLLITNDLCDNGQSELFRSGVHLETYRDADELTDKIRYYLAHDDTRERIAAAGRQEVLARHTYRHRMERILDVCRKTRPEGPASKSREPERTTARAAIRAASEGSVPQPSSLHPQPSRDRAYFEFARPELLALVPENAHTVLDIGCAAGRLGEAIKNRQAARVTGIELDEEAAEQARARLDAVVVGNVEEIEQSFEDRSFDCVVCGDILEHLHDAERLLERVRTWLAPGGRLVASIPNVRHHSVIRSLLDGNWTYQPAGLLDRDHLRFFTRREIERVFNQAGFAIERIQYVPGPGYDEWTQQGRPGKVSIGRLHVGGLHPEDAEEFYVYQFLVVATPVKKPATTRTNSTSTQTSPNGDVTKRKARSPTPECRARRSHMQFKQNFITDFDEFDFWGQPFAFLRFGDGERAICEGRPIQAQDGWAFDGMPNQFAIDL